MMRFALGGIVCGPRDVLHSGPMYLKLKIEFAIRLPKMFLSLIAARFLMGR